MKEKIKLKKENAEGINHFIIWLVVIIITITLFFNVTNSFYRYIYLSMAIILLISGIFEAYKRIIRRENHIGLKNLDFLQSKFLRTNFILSFWSFGIMFIITAILGLFFFNLSLYNKYVLFYLYISSITLIITGILFIIIGIFGKSQKIKFFDESSKFFEIIGITFLFLGCFFYIIRFLINFEYVFEIFFYIIILTGLFLIEIEEILLKNRYYASLILGLIVLFVILSVIDLLIPNFFFFFDFIFFPFLIDFEGLTILSIIEMISETSSMLLILSGFFFIFYCEIPAFRTENTPVIKKNLKLLLQISFIIWISSIILIVIFLTI